MEYSVDLHNHTPLIPSDYRDTSAQPSDLVEAAIAAGVDILAVTDHCSLGYFRRLEETAEWVRPGRKRLLVLPGVELKMRWLGGEVHLVALLPPERCELDFCAIGQSLGIDPDVPADLLPSVKFEADPTHVARLVAERGGICHIAHADRWFGRYRLLGTPLLDGLSAAALSAVEVVHPESAAQLPEWAAALPLLRSSDAHSPAELGRRTTRLDLGELSFEGLRRGLAAAAAIAS